MTDVHSAIWAAIVLVLVLPLATVAMEARAARSRFKEEQIGAAVVALKHHYAALRKLDDPDTPSELIDLALKLSRIVHDSRFVLVVEMMLKEDPNAFKIEATPEDGGPIAEAYRLALAKRPDLAAAFVQAATSGMLAFTLRWPHCAQAFAPLLVELAAQPIKEAQRVVRVAGAAEIRDDHFFGSAVPA